MEAGTPQSRRSLGGLIDRTFEILFRQPVELLLVVLPVSLASYALPGMREPAGEASMRDVGISMVAQLALWGVALIAATLVADGQARGEPLGFGRLFKELALAIPRYVLLQVLWTLAWIGWTLLLFVPGVAFATRSAFAANALALGRASGWNAVSRSETLTAGRRFRVFFTILLFALPSILLEAFFEYLPRSATIYWLGAALCGALSAIAVAGQARLYLDLEEDRAAEGAARAAAAAASAPPPVAPPAPAFAAPSHAAFEASAFSTFEHRGWQQAANAYDAAFRPLTAQAVPALLDAAGVEAGTRLLDVACGPGDVAAAAAERGAHVLGADFAPNMLEVARARHPGIEFRVADAEALPFADSEFDAVTMSFLLGHLGHPERGLAEALRVVRQGGRFAASWWASFDRAVAFGIVMDSLRARGHLDVPLPAGPPFDQFGDPDALARALEAAGFQGVELRPVDMTWRVASGDALIQAYLRGGVRTAGLLRGQSPDELAGIHDEVARRIEPYRAGEEFVMPMPCWVASGARA